MLKYLLAAFLGISTANADIVFSNFTGTANGFGLDVAGGFPQSLAEEFTPAADYSLTDVILELGNGGGSDDAMNVFIFSSSSGLSGSEIEEIGSDLSPAGSESPVTANSIGSPITLVSGTSYWVVLLPEDANSDAFWDNGGSSRAPFEESDTETGTNGWRTASNQLSQMEVDVTAIAATREPASTVAIGCRLVLMGGIRLLRRACKRDAGAGYGDTCEHS
jgi:hypothetical protein